MSDERIRFTRTSSPDSSPLRDKDNAHPQHKPNFAPKPAPNLAPPGMIGIRSSLQVDRPQVMQDSRPQHAPEQNQAGLSIDGGMLDAEPWIDGKIIAMPGYEFQAKVYDAPSEHGIEGGTISKLEVHKDGDLVMSYDRGWDVEPSTPEHREALQRIRTGLDDISREPTKDIDQNPSKHHGIER